jgi:hypothetical protein
VTFTEIQAQRLAEARQRTLDARLRLTPVEERRAQAFADAITRNLGSLLRRTTAGPDNGKGRQALQTTPPAPGEECSIAELRRADLL